jgi:excisionase family DNA binding protein
MARKTSKSIAPQPTTDTDLMDVPETATYTHLQQSTIRSWILQRRIPFVKLGRRTFVRRSDLDRLITGSLVPARKAEAATK